jgi:hypothetical protein
MGGEEFMMLLPSEKILAPIGAWAYRATGLQRVLAPFLASAAAKIGSRLGAGASCPIRSGLGDLTNAEVKQIQSVVNQSQLPLNVVGSAAKGARKAGSDIDYTTSTYAYPHLQQYEGQLPGIDPQHGLLQGAADGPSIRFEPGIDPVFIPGAY